VPTPSAVLDACIIIPASIRDTLRRAAAAGLYRVHWSEAILAEVQRNLHENGMMTEQKVVSLVGVLRKAFPDAIVSGYEPLVDTMLNDPKDRHVMAAAVAAGADVIVTANLKDFPRQALEPFGVIAQSPDDLLTDQFHRSPLTLATIVAQQAADLRAPAMTIEELLASVGKHGPTFAALVGAYISDG